MLRGSLDALTPEGFLTGWAYDEDDPHAPIAVSVWAGDRDVARGVANLYRSDLVEAGRGTGWCAFRLRLSAAPGDLRGRPLSLRRQGERADIVSGVALDVVDDPDARLTSIERILRDDPTTLAAIEALRGCHSMFEAMITEQGLERFIQVAHNYVLDRPADDGELADLADSLRRGVLTPFGLLEALHGRVVPQSGPNLLIAPNEPGFPFRRS